MEVREKILQAAIEVITEKGDITVRAVTEKAGVNVASVKYYFGSKDNLLKEIEEYFALMLFNVQLEALKGKYDKDIDKIKAWALSLMEFVLKYPAVVTLILKIVTNDNKYNPKIVEKVYLNKGMIEEIYTSIGLTLQINDYKLIRIKYMQIFSGLVGAIINEVMFINYGLMGTSILKRPEDRKEYVGLLIDSILITV